MGLPFGFGFFFIEVNTRKGHYIMLLAFRCGPSCITLLFSTKANNLCLGKVYLPERDSVLICIN